LELRDKSIDLESSNEKIATLLSKIKQREKNLSDLNSQIIVLTDELNQTSNNLINLSNILNSKELKYSNLLDRFKAQREKIRYLTGIKLKVISKLKDALGDKINIDKKSGTLRLSSNILFDKGSATLKDGAKVELKSLFIDYIKTLVSDSEVRKYLDLIVIEGHTDSDGSFLYNLELSQKRAYAV